MVSRRYAVIEKKDEVARVIINNPEKRNCLSREVISDLISAYEELRDDDTVAVVITTGSGDISWSAGMSGDLLIGLHEARRRGGGSTPFQLNTLVRYFPKVTVAAVNGYCLGAAISLLNSHDLAIASEERARFGLPEIMRGFPPRYITHALFRAVPMKWAFDMVLTGDNWDARTAQRAGLISRVVPHAELQERALQWAKEIARWDRVTLEYCKKGAHAAMEELSSTKASELDTYICNEHDRVNPKSYQGMRDFLGKTGVKATETIKWI